MPAQKTETHVVAIGGLPTEPDVRRLMEAFPEIAPDQVIPYERTEEILGCGRRSSRWNSVTLRWRKRVLAERNYVIGVLRGIGFVRLTEQARSIGDRIGWIGDQRRAGRRVHDMSKVVTSSLTPEELHTHDHARQVMLHHLDASRQASKSIAAPEPFKALPRGKTAE